MPEMMNPGKIITQQERGMPHKKQHYRDTKGSPRQRRTGMMKPIRFWKDRVTAEVLWETVWGIDSYQNKMRGTSWIGFTCPR
jgi:hypothetical protein